MSILECYLAIEKEKDGKPFIVCDVGTWFYLSIGMIKDKRKLKSEAKRLYYAFDTGEDPSERPATLEELKLLPSNGTLCIIPKSKDKFIPVNEWDK